MSTYQAKYPIVLFDGVCGMCHTFVKTIIALDKDAKFHFAPIDSEAGRAVLAEKSQHPADGTSMILVTDNGVFQKSDAPLNVFRVIGGFFGILASIGLLFPKGLRDFVYGVVARNRYNIAGKLEVCPVPDAGVRGRFL